MTDKAKPKIESTDPTRLDEWHGGLCATCFFACRGPANSIGECDCRIGPPKLVVVTNPKNGVAVPITLFPVMKTDRGCGAHKPDPLRSGTMQITDIEVEGTEDAQKDSKEN